VASFSGAKRLAARRRGASESIIRNLASAFPNFSVTEPNGVAKLIITTVSGLPQQSPQAAKAGTKAPRRGRLRMLKSDLRFVFGEDT
jgi:hypothetical protein